MTRPLGDLGETSANGAWLTAVFLPLPILPAL